MAISTLAVAGISFDAAGLYRQTASAPDNVFIFNDGLANWEIIDKKGPYVARLGGIIPSLADATSALQTILNNSQVKEVVFDEGNITINGVLKVPEGKILTFQNDGRLVGSGTIVGGVINASFESHIFAQTLTITDKDPTIVPPATPVFYPLAVSNKYFSVKWFGAKGDQSVNDQPAIQKTVDTLIALSEGRGKVKTVYLPIGKYRIDAPIILYKWDGTPTPEFPNGRYQYFSLDFIGETSFWEFDNSGTEILTNFIDKFAIGVQAGKGVRIKNIRVTGQFQYQFSSTNADETFFASTYAGFTGTLPCRDERYSPYAGIVIDPFRNSNSIPTDGGYPSLGSYYRGSGGAFGSTGVVIEDCFIANFVVGLITSPNGVTLNAELVDVFRTQFRDNKACIAGCQAQEKINRVSFMACWGTTHTLFMFNHYGAQNPGYWSVDNVNVAGYNNRLVNRQEGGYFPMKFDAIYVEEMGRIGDMDFTMATQFSNSIFDLRHPTTTKQYFLSVATGAGTFRNTCIRYYGFNGGLAPIGMLGNFVFDSCKMYQHPLTPNQTNARGERAYGATVTDNCLGNYNSVVFGVNYPQTVHPDNIYQYYADGKTVIQSSNLSNDAVVSTWSPKYSLPYAYINEFFGQELAVTVSGADNEFTFTATSDELNWVKNGSIISFYSNNRCFGYGVATICNSTGGCLPYSIANTGGTTASFQYTNCSGNVVVESIGVGETFRRCSQVLPTTVTGTLTIAASSNFINIKYIPDTVTNGNYKLKVYRELRFAAFLGDISAGSNLITNVREDMSDLSRFTVDNADNGWPIFAQNVVESQALGADGRTTFLLTNWNNSTKTATANKNFNVTKTGVYFCNNGYIKDISSYASEVNVLTTAGYGGTLLQKGGRVTVMSGGEPLTYLVTKSGYVNAASVGDSRQAEWVLENCCTTSTTTTTP